MLRICDYHPRAIKAEEISPLGPAVPFTPLEILFRDFPRALTDVPSLAGLAVGGLAFRAARFAYLGWASRWAGGTLARGLLGRAISAGAGTLAEGPLFLGATRLVDHWQSKQGVHSQFNPWREWAATEMTLSSLRTFAWAGQEMAALVVPVLGGRFASLAGHLILGGVQVAGLHVAHLLQKNLGLVDSASPDPTLANHLAIIAQFTGMGMMLRHALGWRYAMMEQKIDQQMETQFAPQRTLAVIGAERGGVASISTWKMEGGSDLTSSFSDRPAISTPKRIFPWTLGRDLETDAGTIYVEHGGQKDLSQDPLSVARIKDLEQQVRQLFSKAPEKAFEGFSGLIGRILTTYPSFLWAMKQEMSRAGYKVWFQFDAEKGDLRNALLLDGVDRPRQALLTFPSGYEALELKVDTRPSGLPKLEGNYFLHHPLMTKKVETFGIRRVRYNGVWDEAIDSAQVQQQLFRSKVLNISMHHLSELPVAIQYVIGDQRARWDWLAQPFDSPMLRLDTRFEEYKFPTEKILREEKAAKKKATPKSEPKPEPEPQSEPAASLPPVEPAPQIPVPLPPVTESLMSYQEKLLERLKDIENWADGGQRRVILNLRQIYFELPKDHFNEQMHQQILEAIPHFLSFPYYGVSFVSHYGVIASSHRFKVLTTVQPILSNPHTPSAVAAFEVTRNLRPFLSSEESQKLWEGLKVLHGASKQWTNPTSMIYQARRALEDAPLSKKLLRPTFL